MGIAFAPRLEASSHQAEEITLALSIIDRLSIVRECQGAAGRNAKGQVGRIRTLAYCFAATTKKNTSDTAKCTLL